MRIISKTHDYYDAAQAQGQDRTLVFMRERVEYRYNGREDVYPAALQPFLKRAASIAPSGATLPRNRAKYDDASLSSGLILFVGKLYPFAVVHSQRFPLSVRGDAGFEVTRVCFDLEDLLQVLQALDYELEPTKKFHRWMQGERLDWERFFALRGDKTFEGFAVSERLPILSYERAGGVLQVNPSLAKLQFFRVFDAWAAFQELSMFVGNLANPDNTPVTISDKDRIAQHGFDQYSFRKLPLPR